METSGSTHHRNKYFAGLFSFLIPGLGQLYNGQSKKAIVYFIIGFAVTCFSLLIRMQDSIVWMAVIIAPPIALRAVAMRDAYHTAKGLEHYSLKKYNQGWLYTTIIIFNGVLTGLFAFFPLINFGWYQIPSSGNAPTVEVGDMCIADFNYYRWKKVDYGHMIVFEQNKQHWFFRVVGMPGDKLTLRNGFLLVNGDSCSVQFLKDTTVTGEFQSPFTGRMFSHTYEYRKYIEELPNGHRHLIYLSLADTVFNNKTIEYVVPEDHYFVMGDNRNGSLDSRYIGAVEGRRIKGRMTKTVINGRGDRFNIDLTKR